MRLIRLLKHDLAREIADWVKDGIINASQANAIYSRYGIDADQQSRHTYGYFILMGLGYLFVGLAIIVLLSANWDEIPRGLRMGGLIVATVIANLVGINKYKQGSSGAAVIGFFLGGLLYGASIMLIAQIYHIGEHFPDGIFWWALGVLPPALLLRSRLLILFSTALAFIWFFVEAGMHFYPTLFPVFVTALGWHVLRQQHSNILFVVFVIAIGTWAEYALSWWLDRGGYFRVGPENFVLGIGLFIGFYGWAQYLGASADNKFKDYGSLLAVWVLRFTLIALLVMSFEGSWRSLIRSTWEWATPVMVTVFALSLLSVWLCHRANKPIVGLSVIMLATMLVLLSIFVAEREHATIYQIFDNLVLVGAGIWLVVQGIRQGISHYFFLGVSAILFTGLLRYFDLIGDYVGGALLFGVFAAILLVAARYWKAQQPQRAVP